MPLPARFVSEASRQPLPESLPVVASGSPCIRYQCRACCFDTRMPLDESDVIRLERRTGHHRDAFSLPADAEGPRRLSNKEGKCFFLEEEGCGVYDDRPAGCRIYPLVMDPESGQGVLDEDCPYTRSFRVRPRDRAALATLVDALGL